MATPYLGQISLFGFNFPPKNWAFCNGQTLPINSNQALFSVLGTTYGGNGISTFQLPNLQGACVVSSGTSPYGVAYTLGEYLGEINHSLTQSETPAHIHAAAASSALGSVTSPVNAYPAMSALNPYTTSISSGVNIASTSQGGSQAHSNQSPYLVLNFCIALSGIFPSRN